MTIRVPPWRYAASIVAVFVVMLFGWWKWNFSPSSANDLRACGPRGGQSLKSAASDEGHLAGQSAGRARLDAAFDFLDAQMDLYHRSMVIFSDPEFPHIIPVTRSAMLMISALTPIFAVPPVPAARPSRSNIARRFPVRRAGPRVYFLYPDHNWGQFPGRNLAGATKLAFWVCAEHDTQAEFLMGGIDDAKARYSDSLPKVSTGVIAVTSTWQRHEIDLRDRDLSSVIGGIRGGYQPQAGCQSAVALSRRH